MKMKFLHTCLPLILITALCHAQSDTLETPLRKNVIRYNLSGAMLFGIDKYIVLGYERVIGKHQSFSLNFGVASLPKLVTISTDSLKVSKDQKNSGFNLSVDYRFYLKKENRYSPPHGLYIGPYYFFNQFKRENKWEYTATSTTGFVDTNTNFTIHGLGVQMGYQFILWKRVALDFVMVGPGLGIYNYKAKFTDNLDPEIKEQLLSGLQQMLTQKFPGMNYVFSDDQISGNGTLNTTSAGYRFIIHVGYNF